MCRWRTGRTLPDAAPARLHITGRHVGSGRREPEGADYALGGVREVGVGRVHHRRCRPLHPCGSASHCRPRSSPTHPPARCHVTAGTSKPPGSSSSTSSRRVVTLSPGCNGSARGLNRLADELRRLARARFENGTWILRRGDDRRRVASGRARGPLAALGSPHEGAHPRCGDRGRRRCRVEPASPTQRRPQGEPLHRPRAGPQAFVARAEPRIDAPRRARGDQRALQRQSLKSPAPR
jgi:hypothetical protein